MDYLIAGLLLGSLLAICGYVGREAPGQLPGRAPAWLHDVGTTLMIAGVVVWGIAVVAVLSDLDSGLATSIVWATTVIGVLTAVCVGWFERRNERLLRPAVTTSAALKPTSVMQSADDDSSSPILTNDQPVVELEEGPAPSTEQGNARAHDSADWLATWSSVMSENEVDIETERDTSDTDTERDTANNDGAHHPSLRIDEIDAEDPSDVPENDPIELPDSALPIDTEPAAENGGIEDLLVGEDESGSNGHVTEEDNVADVDDIESDPKMIPLDLSGNQ